MSLLKSAFAGVFLLLALILGAMPSIAQEEYVQDQAELAEGSNKIDQPALDLLAAIRVLAAELRDDRSEARGTIQPAPDEAAELVKADLLRLPRPPDPGLQARKATDRGLLASHHHPSIVVPPMRLASWH